MEILAVTIPILIVVAAGYMLKQRGVIGDEVRRFLSRLVYYLAFPALIFRSIVSFDFTGTFRINLIANNLLATFVVFAVTFLLAFLVKNKNKRGAFHMGCFRSNQGYMGMPVIQGFYGVEAMSKTAIINGFDSSFVTILSVITLEIFAGRKSLEGENVWRLIARKLASMIKNPFVIATVLGLIFSYFKIPILEFKILDELLKMISTMALPLALLSIGCSVEIHYLKDNWGLVLKSAGIKLIAMPVLAFLIARYVFGLAGTDLGLSVVIAAMPTSVSSYILASEMETDERLMATIIGFTTFVSVITISLIQLILTLYFL